MEKEALAIMQQIESIGGSVKAVEQGWIQEQIAESSYKYQKDIESKEQIIVGVNQFIQKENSEMPSFKIYDSIRETQSQKIEHLKNERDNNLVAENLTELKKVALSDQNLMPFVLKCVESYATLGEIANSLREVFGEYQNQ
jgi:methylmalonyl-CoA mutase N-terminal domain/subunit